MHPPQEHVFFHAVRSDDGYADSKKLQRFIRERIKPEHVKDTAYGQYWYSVAVKVLRERYESREHRKSA